MKEIPLFKVLMCEKAIRRTMNVMNSGFITQGPVVDEFESRLRRWFKRQNVVTTNSCTSAIDLSYKLIKLKDPDVGKKVIMSPLTCAAGVFPAIHNSFDIVWSDIGDDFNIDMRSAESLLDEDTQILSFVHWGGMPVDMRYIRFLKDFYQKKFGKPLYVIEDCAHAIDSRIQWERISTIEKDHFKCYSFQAIKHLTTGDGGALLCSDEFYKEAKLLRWFGLDREAKQDFRGCQNISLAGYKYHMNDISASMGSENLKHLDYHLSTSRRNARYYNENLPRDGEVFTSVVDKFTDSSYWLYTIRAKNRGDFIEYMKEKGIQCSPVHFRNDHHSALSKFPVAKGNIDVIAQQNVSIPVGSWVKEEDTKRIVEAIKDYAR